MKVDIERFRFVLPFANGVSAGAAFCCPAGAAQPCNTATGVREVGSCDTRVRNDRP